MGKISGLTGTPWHVEILGNSEDEDRRHRARCSFYINSKANHCNYYNEKCRGAAHCIAYKEKVDKGITEPAINNEVKPFKNIRLIDISKIAVPKGVFKKPSEEKIKKLIEHYNLYGDLDKPIVVKCDGSNYLLVDKYLRYLVAKQLELKEIYAEMGSQDDLINWNKLREIGTLVWLNKPGEVGEVVGFSINKVTIRFDDGVTHEYDIHTCLSTGTIRVL